MTRHARSLLALALILSCAVGPAAHAQGRKGKRTGARRQQPAATPVEDERAAPHLEVGLRLAEGGDFEGAIQAFRQAVAVSPRHPEAHIHLADAYMAAGRYEEAFASYRQAVQVAPWNPDAHHGLGAAYNDMGQHGDAFKHFVQAIRLDPNFAEAYYGIGFAYQRLDNFREALGFLRSALRLRPDYAEARLSLGLTYLGLGDLKAAEEQLRLLEASDAGAADALRRELRGAAAESPAETASRPAPAPAPAARPTPSPRPTPAAAESRREDESRRMVEAARAQAPQPAAPPDAVELAFWESIKDSSDPEEFAAYLKKYPQGQFSDLARLRQRALAARRAETTPAEGAAPATPSPAATPTTTPSPTPTPDIAAPAETPTPAPTPTPPPAPPPAPPRPPTLPETLEWLRQNFSTRFSYTYTVRGEGPAPTSHEANISYEPILFQGCNLEWRDGSDTLSVSLSELDPQALRVERRSEPDTTFAAEVWNLVVAATGGARAFREVKGDGSGAINSYHAVTLQLDSRERAESLADRLRHAVKLCGGKSATF